MAKTNHITLTLFIVLLSGVLASPVNSATYHTKQWSAASILESFPDNNRFKYYLEPQLRLIDNRYVFNQAFFLVGLGYQVTPTIVMLMGPGWTLTKNNQGEMTHEYQLWQQINWNMMTTPHFSVISRTRLQERKLTNNAQVSVRFRERLWARIPFTNWPSHSLSLFDEMFFNLNQPEWVTQRFFEQNRAFIGIGTPLSPTAIVDVGYLNQLQFTSPTQISNVLLLTLTVNA